MTKSEATWPAIFLSQNKKVIKYAGPGRERKRWQAEVAVSVILKQ